MFDNAIFQILQSTTQITDLITDRVFPLRRPQTSDIPALTYRKVFSNIEYSDDGKVAYTDISYDVFLYAESYSTLEQLFQAVLALSGTTCTFWGQTVRSLRVEDIGDDDYLEDLNQYTHRVEIKVTFG